MIVRLLHRHTALLISLMLVAVTLAVFGQVVRFGFLRFDDDVYITMNTEVLQYGLSRVTVLWAFVSTYNANWHPLTWLSYLTDVELFQFNPAGFHLTNLILHTANVLLLFLVLRRLTGGVWKSAFVAALFAVHPLHVESVAWVSERKDVLSTLFWFLTMWAYVRYTERTTSWRQIIVWGVFILGLMAKPMLVTLPIVLLLLDYWPLRRIGNRKQSGKQSLMDLLWEKFPLFGFSLASCLITFQAQKAGGAMKAMETFPLHLRAANALVAYVNYICKMILPINLSPFYPHPGSSIAAWQVIGSALILIAITALVIRNARTKPYLAFGWLWYLVTLVPVIGLVQVGTQGMADRYTYVPLIGLFIMVAWGFSDVMGHIMSGDKAQAADAKPPTPRFCRSAALWLPGIAVVALLAAGAWWQTGYWENSILLFEHGIAVTKDNDVLHANLALTMQDIGRSDEAIKHNREAIRIDPKAQQAHNNLAVSLFSKGNYAEAWKEIHIAQDLGVVPNPEFIEALSEKMPEPEDDR